MKILISCLSFESLTGSELYALELAKELSKSHDVYVLAMRTGEYMTKMVGEDVNVCNIPPNFFMGDGKRKYVEFGEEKTTSNGFLYRIGQEKFDLILSNHARKTWAVESFYPNTPILNIIHSEIIPNFEDPLIHPNVVGYIAIRESIKGHLIKNFDIEPDKISVIENPVDTERFNTKDTFDDGFVLFVGSLDYLRWNVINDLIHRTKREGLSLALIGRGMTELEIDKRHKHVTCYEPISNVEDYTKCASYVSSILYGRTAIEGHLCGKDVLLYDVNGKGHINCAEMTSMDPQEAYERHNPSKVVERVLDAAKKYCNI